MLRTAGGRLFHVWGPQTEKARLPKWVLVRFTTAALVSDDLSWRRCESAVLNSTRSVRYDGQRLLWRIWCTSVAVLKIMRNLTGSQCSCCSAEVICDCRSRLSTNPAAAFCTRCRGASKDAGRPENTELQYIVETWDDQWHDDLRHDVSTDTVPYLTQASQMVETRVFAWIVRCPAKHRGHERHQRTEWLTNRQSMNDTRLVVWLDCDVCPGP